MIRSSRRSTGTAEAARVPRGTLGIAGLVAVLGLAMAGPARAEAPRPVTPLADHPMRLTLDETFASWPSSDIWTPWIGYGAHPEEEQMYVPEAVSPLPGGGLRLAASRKTFLDKAFVSGAVTSQSGFFQTYGHFEMKAKLPKGAGLWSAFWLLPASSWPPEIDIVEHLGRAPGTLFFSLHAKVGQDVRSKTLDYNGADVTEGYHVYAVDWRPDLLVWSVDGVERARLTENVPQQPMYMILNLALGTEWPGPVKAATPFPSVMDIAYVRVFQFEDLPQQSPACLRVSPLAVTPAEAKPGEAVTVSGTLQAGSQAVSAAKVSLYLKSFTGKDYVGFQEINLPAMDAGATAPFSASLTLPAGSTLPRFAVDVSATAIGCQIIHHGATQVVNAAVRD